MKLRLSKKFAPAFVLIALMSTDASADSIIKFNLSTATPSGPDVVYSGGVLSTPDDGNAATAGLQDSSILFVNGLAFMPDLLSGASMSLSGVAGSGLATVLSGVITQMTVGGVFDLYGADNSLLLSGALDSGVISGGTSSSTGSFFNSTAATFTGGSLLAFVAPTPAGVSIALSNIMSELGMTGMAVTDGCVGACQLRDFTAAANGLMDGQPVPEPASLLLLISGLFGGTMLKRRNA